jgi:hypothetical protein
MEAGPLMDGDSRELPFAARVVMLVVLVVILVAFVLLGMMLPGDLVAPG